MLMALVRAFWHRGGISNIFVDDAWNTTSIIDLERAASKAAEMLAPAVLDYRRRHRRAA